MPDKYHYRDGAQVQTLPKAPDGWNLTIIPSQGIGIGDVEAILTNRFSKATVRAAADTVVAAVRKVNVKFNLTHRRA